MDHGSKVVPGNESAWNLPSSARPSLFRAWSVWANAYSTKVPPRGLEKDRSASDYEKDEFLWPIELKPTRVWTCHRRQDLGG